MRADRLLATLLLLQAHGRLPARAVAERLEVSERTVHRDMEALSMAGVPVYAERGRRGGWVLDEAYRTDLTGLTEAELRSLVVATQRGALADLGLGAAAERAVLKLLAALPETQRRDAEAARSYLHVDPSGWRRPDEAATALPTLDLALRTGRRIVLTYERATDRTVVERTVDPLGLVAKGSVWYLVASADGDQRTYRVSRIQAVDVLDEPAVRPADFDLPRAWAQGQAEFRAALPSTVAVIRYAPTVMPRVRLGWRFARVESESPPDTDGWVTCRIRADSIEVAVECALGFGADAEVLEPAELRERVTAGAAAVVARDAARILRP